MKKSLLLPLAVICAIALSGCASSRKAVAPGNTKLPRDLEVVSKAVKTEPAKDARIVLNGAISLYNSWEEVSLDGKMSMKGLAVDPSAKIYMKRGSELLISVRAPIIGEVARVEIADDSVIVANRLKKIYVCEDLVKLRSYIDISITDLQDMFLGRMFLLGNGTLDASGIKQMDVSSAPSGGYIVTPRRQPQQANYGFALYYDCMLQLLFAASPDRRYEANAEYTWDADGSGAKDTDITLSADGHSYKASFSFKAPDFSPNRMKRMELGKKWRKVSIREFLKSM